jgi:pimeloyl-ACP methyl ester carboxylesterase
LNLVFAHGYLGFKSLLGIDYYRGLQARITRLGGHAALFPQVPPFGTYEDRARALADAIQQAYPEGPVHIIAHSMGGLDSRFLIACNLHGLSNAGRIASLTTLSTPHRGSPVADLLAGPRPHGPRRLLYDGISRAIGLLGIETGALANIRQGMAAVSYDTTAAPYRAQDPGAGALPPQAAGRGVPPPAHVSSTLTENLWSEAKRILLCVVHR